MGPSSTAFVLSTTRLGAPLDALIAGKAYVLGEDRLQMPK
jgi:hypothetical protein